MGESELDRAESRIAFLTSEIEERKRQLRCIDALYTDIEKLRNERDSAFQKYLELKEEKENEESKAI